jgi:hypothetical protein
MGMRKTWAVVGSHRLAEGVRPLIVATRAGRRIEVVTPRGVVEVREVTRTGVPIRTGVGTAAI